MKLNRRNKRKSLKAGIGLAICAAGAVGATTVVRSALACPPSFSPVEVFDLTLESAAVDGVAVELDSMDTGDVTIRAAMREGRIYISHSSSAWAAYARK